MAAFFTLHVVSRNLRHKDRLKDLLKGMETLNEVPIHRQVLLSARGLTAKRELMSSQRLPGSRVRHDGVVPTCSHSERVPACNAGPKVLRLQVPESEAAQNSRASSACTLRRLRWAVSHLSERMSRASLLVRPSVAFSVPSRKDSSKSPVKYSTSVSSRGFHTLFSSSLELAILPLHRASAQMVEGDKGTNNNGAHCQPKFRCEHEN